MQFAPGCLEGPTCAAFCAVHSGQIQLPMGDHDREVRCKRGDASSFWIASLSLEFELQ